MPFTCESKKENESYHQLFIYFMYAAAYVIAEDLWFASFIVICVKNADANCKKLKKLCLITILCSRKIIFNVEKWHQMSKSRFLQRDIFHNDLLDYSLGSMRSPKTFITDVYFLFWTSVYSLNVVHLVERFALKWKNVCKSSLNTVNRRGKFVVSLKTLTDFYDFFATFNCS